MAVAFFTPSIIVDTYLLAGSPSVVMRLSQETSASNNIYEMRLFGGQVRLGFVYVLSHWYFAFGLLSFCASFLVGQAISSAGAAGRHLG